MHALTIVNTNDANGQIRRQKLSLYSGGLMRHFVHLKVAHRPIGSSVLPRQTKVKIQKKTLEKVNKMNTRQINAKMVPKQTNKNTNDRSLTDNQ